MVAIRSHRHFRPLLIRRRRSGARGIATAFVLMVGALCPLSSSVFAGQMAAQSFADEPIQPLPTDIDLDPSRVSLGARLFHDPGLSGNGEISCATCHVVEQGGATSGERYAPAGVSGLSMPINVPTVFNSGFNFIQFWDGRADSLEDQIDGPIHNPDEMASDWDRILAYLRSDPDLVRLFKEAYGEEPSESAAKNAIATYERSLVTPDAPFDRYLRGETGAIGAEALLGYRLFKSYGCVACHQGRNVGGNMLQIFGVVEDYFQGGEKSRIYDLGRFNVTGREVDRHVFKVPSLRNVAVTPPYFHDGSAETLDQAVETMARFQLGRNLTAKDRDAIVAFLESLTGVRAE